MSADPGGDVRTALNGAGIGLTAGTNLFDGPEQPYGTGVPHAATFVLPTGGPAPRPFIGMSVELRHPYVQVTSRSDPDDYNGGEAQARAIRDALHRQVVARGVGGDYTECIALQDAPNYLGMDRHRRHRWTNNFQLWHRE
jgi:hypothetical protein